MPVNVIPSAEARKAKKTASQRRRNQNNEIGQLEALLPWKPQTPTVPLVSNGGPIDKISVLRLTTAYMKFKDFWKNAVEHSSSDKPGITGAYDRLFSEAMDGFLLIISTTGEILFSSESIKDFIGIFQPEVIGQSIYDITHEDDAKSIKQNLQPRGVRPNQFRQFYARFKSSISSNKKQLSKFGGHLMVQVSGNLKMYVPKGEVRPRPLGLIAECRLIESSSSILEVSIPQSSFTSTTSMDLKILTLDTKAHCLTGFKANQVKGTDFTDFFHPSDNKKSINCLKLLLITGEAVSPVLRFMTHTGEWIWVQLHGLTRYEADNQTPKFIEVTCKIVCSTEDGDVQMIEHKELYGHRSSLDSSQSTIHADSRFTIPEKLCEDSPSAVVEAIESTKVSPAVRDVLLHSRETTLANLPKQLNRYAQWDDVRDAVVAYEVSKGLPPNYKSPYPQAPKKCSSDYPIPSVSSSPPPLPDSTTSPTSVDSISPPPLDDSAGPSSVVSSLGKSPLTHFPQSHASNPYSLSPIPSVSSDGISNLYSLSPLSSVSSDGISLGSQPPSVSQPPPSWGHYNSPPGSVQQPPSVSRVSPVPLPGNLSSSTMMAGTHSTLQPNYYTPAPLTSQAMFPDQHQATLNHSLHQPQVQPAPVPSHIIPQFINGTPLYQPMPNSQYNGTVYSPAVQPQPPNHYYNVDMGLNPGIPTAKNFMNGYPTQAPISCNMESFFEVNVASQPVGISHMNDDEMIEVLQQLM